MKVFIKLKSFTIIELVVIMVVSSIVIFAAITGFLKIQSLFQQTQDNNNITQQIGLLHNTLYHDFEQAYKVRARYNDLYFDMPDESIIRYELNYDNVIRMWDDHKEKFFINTKSYSFESLDRRRQYINEIKIEFEYKKIIFPVYLYKNYPYRVKYEVFNKDK